MILLLNTKVKECATVTRGEAPGLKRFPNIGLMKTRQHTHTPDKIDWFWTSIFAKNTFAIPATSASRSTCFQWLVRRRPVFIGLWNEHPSTSTSIFDFKFNTNHICNWFLMLLLLYCQLCFHWLLDALKLNSHYDAYRYFGYLCVCMCMYVCVWERA